MLVWTKMAFYLLLCVPPNISHCICCCCHKFVEFTKETISLVIITFYGTGYKVWHHTVSYEQLSFKGGIKILTFCVTLYTILKIRTFYGPGPPPEGYLENRDPYSVAHITLYLPINHWSFSLTLKGQKAKNKTNVWNVLYQGHYFPPFKMFV